MPAPPSALLKKNGAATAKQIEATTAATSAIDHSQVAGPGVILGYTVNDKNFVRRLSPFGVQKHRRLTSPHSLSYCSTPSPKLSSAQPPSSSPTMPKPSTPSSPPSSDNTRPSPSPNLGHLPSSLRLRVAKVPLRLGRSGNGKGWRGVRRARRAR